MKEKIIIGFIGGAITGAYVMNNYLYRKVSKVIVDGFAQKTTESEEANGIKKES